jgi:alkanesulfonate monooxygenase SsuD/methylene tetrahydromethanopterin reductase-like flavin-dependent oxidoreductase (luciferase family)
MTVLGVVTVYDGTPMTVRAVEIAAQRAALEREPLTVIVVARRVPPYAETIAEAREAAQRQDQGARRHTREVLARCDTSGLTPQLLVSPRRARRALAAVLRGRRFRVAVVPGRSRPWRWLDRATVARLQRSVPTVIVTRR